MPRFMGYHTFPKNAFTYEQVCQLGDASQQDEKVKGYRSFINTTEGRAVCILDAPDKAAVEGWFKAMKLPYDTVVEVEVEGEGGKMQEIAHLEAAHA